MNISEKGINLIKEFEGCRLESYKDIVGRWTIGWGHASSDVHENMQISQEDADRILLDDLGPFEKGVSKLVKIPLNQNQFDALVCFSYNLGLGSLENSTLLKLLNQGNLPSASLEFVKWNKAGGKEVAGLTRRRQAEYSLFIS